MIQIPNFNLAFHDWAFSKTPRFETYVMRLDNGTRKFGHFSAIERLCWKVRRFCSQSTWREVGDGSTRHGRVGARKRVRYAPADVETDWVTKLPKARDDGSEDLKKQSILDFDEENDDLDRMRSGERFHYCWDEDGAEVLGTFSHPVK